MTRIYVGNLPVATNEGQLHVIFGAHGVVEEVTVVTDRLTGQSKGFAFVKMSRNDEARAAISSLDGSMVGDKRLKVDEARSERNKSWADQ
jgi:RNA recognition motif-containing protein